MFKQYIAQVMLNAKAMANALLKKGFTLVSGTGACYDFILPAQNSNRLFLYVCIYLSIYICMYIYIVYFTELDRKSKVILAFHSFKVMFFLFCFPFSSNLAHQMDG